MTNYQQIIAASRYGRWDEDKQRREMWPETVARMVGFWQKRCDLTDAEAKELRDATTNLQVMSSMRGLWTAGKALEQDEAAIYNCAAIGLSDPQHSLPEVMYLLMLGCGVGFSVEEHFISNAPIVAEEFHDSDSVITVGDSRIGWCKAFKTLLSMLYAGDVPQIDYSRIREKGEPLKTFGGRASGSGPLEELFNFTIKTFRASAGKRLSSECLHDLCTMTGNIVIAGSVRRSAEISLGDQGDVRHRRLKTGAWGDLHGHRAMANNSAVYDGRPDLPDLMDEMLSLFLSYSGERGIFNRQAAQKKAAKVGRDPSVKYLCNPCAEILLDPDGGLCNLSEVVIRPDDKLEDGPNGELGLLSKVRLATIYGTMQSSLVNFRFLRKSWSNNASKLRLLGVSLTGICDHKVMSGRKGEKVLAEWLTAMKEEAYRVNKEWAARLGIPESAAICTVKPSGTVSQTVACSSGIHPAYAPYYARTIRQDVKDPICDFLIDAGVQHEPCVMKPETTMVFTFPQKAPKGALTVDDVGTIEQLELARMYNEHWACHTVSITAYYEPHNYFEVCQWVYDNFSYCIGLSFLPKDNGSYKQAVYTRITKEEYDEMVAKERPIDWSKLTEFELEDRTQGAHELACVGDKCEIS
jgi:ribonucleoside-diphosphate reductase alpha chain